MIKSEGKLKEWISCLNETATLNVLYKHLMSFEKKSFILLFEEAFVKTYKAQNEGTDHDLLPSMCTSNQVMNELDPLMKDFLERSGLMLHGTSEFKYLSDSNRKVFLEIITKYYWNYLYGDHSIPDPMEIRSECLSSSCWREIKKKTTTPRFLKGNSKSKTSANSKKRTDSKNSY